MSDLVALVSCTEPGRLYSGGPVSPPGLSDISRASSLTNKHCVGLKEKPPRRCQNKSPRPVKTFELSATCTVYGLVGVHLNFHTC